MRETPSYMSKSKDKIPFSAFTITLLCLWTLFIGLTFTVLNQQHLDTQPPTNTQNLSPWVTSTANQINQVRQLTKHLARDYQTVEFLADTSESGDQLSSYWQFFQNKYPYIRQIGVIEEESSDHFFIGGNPTQLIPSSNTSEELVNYWMQVGLLQRGDILFFAFQHKHRDAQFRFTTPVHYDDMKLGHLYIDFDINQLLSHTSQQLLQRALVSEQSQANIIMLDKEGRFVAESETSQWSAKEAFSEGIGYYYPEFWQGMNSGLSGRFSTVSQTTYFSKLDIPWYQNQIKYFYLVQIAEKPTPTPLPKWDGAWLAAWIIGLIGLLLMQHRARLNK